MLTTQINAMHSGCQDELLDSSTSPAIWQVVSVAVDPVCRMDVAEAQAKYATVYEGVKYYFCSAACKQEFEKRPTKYISR
jgi:YHS domain-containing protein